LTYGADSLVKRSPHWLTTRILAWNARRRGGTGGPCHSIAGIHHASSIRSKAAPTSSPRRIPSPVLVAAPKLQSFSISPRNLARSSGLVVEAARSEDDAAPGPQAHFLPSLSTATPPTCPSSSARSSGDGSCEHSSTPASAEPGAAGRPGPAPWWPCACDGPCWMSPARPPEAAPSCPARYEWPGQVVEVGRGDPQTDGPAGGAFEQAAFHRTQLALVERQGLDGPAVGRPPGDSGW